MLGKQPAHHTGRCSGRRCRCRRAPGRARRPAARQSAAPACSIGWSCPPCAGSRWTPRASPSAPTARAHPAPNRQPALAGKSVQGLLAFGLLRRSLLLAATQAHPALAVSSASRKPGALVAGHCCTRGWMFPGPTSSDTSEPHSHQIKVWKATAHNCHCWRAGQPSVTLTLPSCQYSAHAHPIVLQQLLSPQASQGQINQTRSASVQTH